MDSGSTALQRGANAALGAETLLTVEIGCVPDVLGGREINAALILLNGKGKARGTATHNLPVFDGGAARICLPLSFSPQRFEVEPARLPRDVERVLVVLASDEPSSEGLSKADSISVRILGTEGMEIASFRPDPKECPGSALIVAELYRKAGAWRIRAVGQGYKDGLAALALAHSVDPPRIGPRPAGAAREPNLGAEEAARAFKKGLAAGAAEAGLRDVGFGAVKAFAGIDASGSMLIHRRSGALERIRPVLNGAACVLARGGEGEARVFGTALGEETRAFGRFGGASPAFSDAPLEGGGSWAAAMSGFSKSAPKDGLALALLVGDGDADDVPEAAAVLAKSSASPIFWTFLVLESDGPAPRGRAFLEALSDASGRAAPNAVALFSSESLEKTADRFGRAWALWLREVRRKRLLPS